MLGVFAIGKAAHGSSPFSGDSAAIRAIRFLAEIAPLSAKTFYEELLSLTHIGGAGLGIAGVDDESQDLTCNLGIVKLEARAIDLLFNIRYPVTWNGDMLREKCLKKLASYSSRFELSVVRDSPPLFFPADHPLVKAIVDVYEIETGERKEPGSMGGGTYARAVANTISIGTGWEGDGAAHETDERLAIESLYRMSRIYAHLFYRLGQEALGQR